MKRPLTKKQEVDAVIAFVAKGSWLFHPDVSPYMGTVNGDSEEKWNRRYYRALLNAAAGLKKGK